MPKKNDKRVILVSGSGSNWYEQAIFIVKDKNSRLPIDIVKEAENIIKKYIADNKLKDVYKPNTQAELGLGAYPKNRYQASEKNNKLNNKINKGATKGGAIRQTSFILDMAIALCMILIGFLVYLVFKM